MFPIRDHNPSGTVPFVTVALIGVNVFVFLMTYVSLGSPAALERFYMSWAAVPAQISAGQDWVTLVTAMFLHGGWLHLLGNMLFLWIFGDNLEDAFGHGGFLVFYLCCGLAAGLAQIAVDPASPIPMVGASGAIAGVMGGYLLLYPRAQVDIVVIIFIFIRLFIMPAWLVLTIWFGIQLLAGLVADPTQAGVAYMAHVGGFGAGLLLTLPLWFLHGGPRHWRRTEGAPPWPPTPVRNTLTTIPRVRRR
ncbi:MAG: rhomboid family intramembrane serine protease [Paracoccaceae bacterium]|nr:rhomboid family intramembrane serine protease [Paracoccaceae bacterium]MDE3120804.1 rhomboid family intramembrane serine protease [Paracoccaceae bacterium]